jgi:hypothetical protein
MVAGDVIDDQGDSAGSFLVCLLSSDDAQLGSSFSMGMPRKLLSEHTTRTHIHTAPPGMRAELELLQGCHFIVEVFIVVLATDCGVISSTEL